MSEDDTTTGTDECNSFPTDFTQRLQPPALDSTDPSPDTSNATPAMPHFIPNPCPKLEISFGTQTMTDEDYPNETLTDLILTTPTIAQAQPSEAVPLIHAEPVRLEPEPQPAEQIVRPLQATLPEPSIPTPVSNRCPDISGLELLSNSIEAFEKHIFIKKEPGVEKPKETYLPPPPSPSPIPHSQLEQVQPPSIIPNTVIPASTVAAHGSLDILCALAEQRFQEEVGSMRTSRKRSSSSDASESKRPRKHHKEKHSSRKAAKRSKHRKERKDKKRKGSDEDDETVKQDLSESYNRVKAKLGCCSCKPEPNAMGEQICRCMWPSAEEVYIAMNSDMRNRLAQMAKEVQEEKRKLHEFKTLQNVIESPLRSVSSVSDAKVTSDTETFPAFRFGDGDADTTHGSGLLNKRSDEQTTTSDVVASKKAKSLVEYIFASKNRLPATPDRHSTLDENSHQSSSASVKQEIGDPDDLFGVEKRSKSKHSLKHKKAKSSKERKHRRSSEIKERKRRIDARCTLTSDQLDGLMDKSNLRVLTAMGGLFYAGCLSAVQPPDVYAVTLDGERGNRPHFMSREDVLRDAVSLKFNFISF